MRHEPRLSPAKADWEGDHAQIALRTGDRSSPSPAFDSNNVTLRRTSAEGIFNLSFGRSPTVVDNHMESRSKSAMSRED